MTVKLPCSLSSWGGGGGAAAETHIFLIDDHPQGEMRTSGSQYFFSTCLYNLGLTCYSYTLEILTNHLLVSDFLTPNPLLQGVDVGVWLYVSRCECSDGCVGVSGSKK
jgi:hypothetical protein